jgi:hypothetical protein
MGCDDDEEEEDGVPDMESINRDGDVYGTDSDVLT